jgi:histidyl-tRNA synthetase
MEYLGGPATPAVGFAVGIDRLMFLVQNMAAEVPPIFVLAAQDVAESYALNVSQKLRLAGKKVQMPLSGNLKKRLSKADKAGAEFAVIIGEDEMNSGMLTLRNLKTGEQIQSSFENLIHKL